MLLYSRRAGRCRRLGWSGCTRVLSTGIARRLKRILFGDKARINFPSFFSSCCPCAFFFVAKAVVVMWNAFEADQFDNRSFGILADSGLGILLTRRTCWVFCVARAERGNPRRQSLPEVSSLYPVAVLFLSSSSSLQRLIQDLMTII